MRHGLGIACVVLGIWAWSSAAVFARQTPVATPIAPVGLELVYSLQRDAAPVDQETLLGIRSMLQRRLGELGLSGQVSRSQNGDIVVHVDATTDPEQTALALARAPQLEIIDTQGQWLPPGTLVRTTLSPAGSGGTPTPEAPIYETIISGSDVLAAYPTEGATPGVVVVGFTLTPEAAVRFYAHTSSHIGQPMSIVLDTRVISSPVINGAISSAGIIEGVPSEEVPALVAQLQAGSGGGLLVLKESRVVPVRR